MKYNIATELLIPTAKLSVHIDNIILVPNAIKTYNFVRSGNSVILIGSWCVLFQTKEKFVKPQKHISASGVLTTKQQITWRCLGLITIVRATYPCASGHTDTCCNTTPSIGEKTTLNPPSAKYPYNGPPLNQYDNYTLTLLTKRAFVHHSFVRSWSEPGEAIDSVYIFLTLGGLNAYIPELHLDADER